MGRSRGGLTSKIHALVDTDNRLAAKLLSRLKSGSMLLADRCVYRKPYSGFIE